MLRTTNAGALRLSDAGSQVTLAGWVGKRRDHGGIAFLDLRDSTGTVQVVVDSNWRDRSHCRFSCCTKQECATSVPNRRCDHSW